MITTTENKNYVMKGNSINRALDKYHLILAPSYGCNLSCKHCYLSSHASDEMLFDDIKKILHDWSSIVRRERGGLNGIFHLKGGEPLYLPYLYDIFDLLREEKTCSLMITTNGTLGNEAFFSEVKRLDDELENSTVIIVSLDGSREELHSLLRGKGNFNKTVDFIKRLTSQDITVHINYVVHSKNLFDLENCIDLASSLGVSQINFLKFVPNGYGNSIADWVVDPVTFNKRMMEIYESASPETQKLLTGNLGYILDKEKHGDCTSCECVGGYRGLFYIVPNGDVFSCPNLIVPKLGLGNIHSVSLHSLHKNTAAIYDVTKHLNNNQYLCKGELLKVNTSGGGLKTEKRQDGTSYCYSRNF